MTKKTGVNSVFILIILDSLINTRGYVPGGIYGLLRWERGEVDKPPIFNVSFKKNVFLLGNPLK